MKTEINGDLSHDSKVEADSLNQLEIAFPVRAGERFQGEKKARTRGHRLDLAWQQSFWKKTHPLCLRCLKDCKQSSQVKIIACPQFQSEVK